MDGNIDVEKILEGLSPKERELFLAALQEYSKSGESKTFEKLLYEDYKEIPVDIDTFLHDPTYLGKGLTDDEGRFTVFPYWEKTLKKLFPTNIDTAYNTLVLSGAIGIGKSFVAVIAMLYLLYRMLCLEDPYKHYGLQPIDHITFSLMNITLDAAKGVAWSKLQELLQSSPWFMSHGHLDKSQTPVWQPNINIELLYGSQPRHVIGRAVFCSFEDEVSFVQNQSVEKQKEKAMLLISSVDARMQSRFMRGDKLPTLHLIASSKRTDQSFLESYIAMKKKNNSKTTLIVDEPQWVVDERKVTGKWFPVAVGNKFLESHLLPDDATEKDLLAATAQGYEILMVPSGYKEKFMDNLDIALTDIAGKSTTNSMNYISGVRWAKCMQKNQCNPFTKDVITVGNDPKDLVQYYDFFDLNKIDHNLINKPLFIHLDMSFSGDKTGIAGVWIKGKTPHREGVPDSSELYYKVAFSVSIEAPKGRQISFEKNRQFLYWLREKGFNICGISFDTFASPDMKQTLLSKGFNCETISVDRIDTQSRTCLPYLTFKNAIYEERVEVYEENCKQLTAELIGLVRDSNGKIDHTKQGINCLSGDTLIRLVDGRSVKIKDLVTEYEQGKINYVYSINESSGLIEAKPIIKAFKSGEIKTLVEIKLDSGEVIKCTPEHRFMLRDGTFVEAQNLKENDSLMPLYTKLSDKGLMGYRLFFEPAENKWHFEHRRFATEILDKKYLVHHKDCNKLNNNPDNLIWMSKSAHTITHAQMQTGACSPEALLKKSKSIKKVHQIAKQTLEGQLRYYHNSWEELKAKKEKHRLKEEKRQQTYAEINMLFNIDFINCSDSDKRRYMALYNNYKVGKKINFKLSEYTSKEKKELSKQFTMQACEYYGVDYNTLDKDGRHSYVIRYYNDTVPGYKENITDAVSKNHKKGKYKKAKKALQHCNELSHLRALERYYASEKYKRICDIERIFKVVYNDLSYHEKLSYGHLYSNMVKKGYKTNHKVKSITFIKNIKSIEVFDLTIQDNHNFALDCGIFVHNSKDQVDAVCGAIWYASQFAEQYAYDYGESMEFLKEMNQGDDAEVKQLTISFEEELKKMNNSLDKHKLPRDVDEGTDDYDLYGDNIITLW